MKKNLVSTLAIIAAATAVFGMTASADDVKTAEIVLEAENAPYTYEDDNGEPAGYEYEVLKLIDDYLDDWTFNYTVLDYETALAGTTSGKIRSGFRLQIPYTGKRGSLPGIQSLQLFLHESGREE